jgi:hypothetical protein
MDDLDVIELKALVCMEQAQDLDTLAKVAGLLHGVDQQRKLRMELASAASRPQKAKAERRQDAVRFWSATLLPAFAFLVTAFTFMWQIEQGKQAARAQEDSQWRSAVEKIGPTAPPAAVGVLEMKSFFVSDYAKESRPVAASLLVAVDDPNIFDDVYFDLVNEATPTGDGNLIALARALTSRLKDTRDRCISARRPGRAQATPSLADFLDAPGDYCDNQSDLDKIEADTVKLDSVSQGLSALWKNPTRKMTPKGEDLNGIVFLDGDFSKLDFQGASLIGSVFYGDCRLEGTSLDSNASLNRCTSGNSKSLVAAAH